MTGRHKPCHAIIALIGSAGGLAVIKRVLSELSEGFDAAVVVLIHQQPDRESDLVEILARSCPLPVVEAQDGAALQPGVVVVIPPGCHLLVDRWCRVRLIVSGASPPNRPSGDLLLATLATAAGPRAIAVILSGGGHDGATGATAVHAFGGTVLATDEATSEHFSMPKATINRDHAIDHVVAVEDITMLLEGLVSAPRLDPPSDPPHEEHSIGTPGQ
jgi:two-component system chemotaxis response regulator CheB